MAIPRFRRDQQTTLESETFARCGPASGALPKIGSLSRSGSHLEPLPGAVEIRTEIAGRLLLMARQAFRA